MSKVFALVDCNNFYASCERVFNPKLDGKAVVVLSNNDGVIISRSDEAKALGIKMGTPVFDIVEKLKKNNVHVFSSNYTLYGDLSQRVMSVLASLSPEIEIYSIDEAFLDLRGITNINLNDFGANIKKTIDKWIGIPVTVGISTTKTLAKLANHYAKKHFNEVGVFDMCSQESITEVLKNTLVEEIWGIGEMHTKFLNNNNIQTANDLCNADEKWIKKHMSVMGERTVLELRGKACYSLEEMPSAKKGILTSRSYGKALEKYEDIEEATTTFVAALARKLRKQNSCATAITVFLMTNKFASGPRYVNGKSIQLPTPTNNTAELIHYAVLALKSLYRKGYKYKKSGIIATDLIPADHVQTSLWDATDRGKNKKLMDVVDKINSELGRNKIKFAIQGTNNNWKMRQEQLSPCYTTKWDDLLELKV
ncbi:MAG: Y-family DNA polymerase [Saprospiraceae bacterium]|nr:Y-family DNA polymerase [Saprospiraceae bacterium]